MTETRTKVSRYYEALYDVARAISSSLEREMVLRHIVDGVANAAQAKACSILLLSPDRKSLVHEANHGLSDSYMRKGPVSVDVSMADALQGKAVAVRNACEDPRIQYREQARREGIVSLLCVPVTLRQEVVGVMRLYTSEPRDFDDEDSHFLTAVANLGAIALENAKLYETTKEADALRKRLFAVTCHDLREPLVTVQSYLNAILGGFAGDVPVSLREMLERIARRIEELLELHSAILDARGFDPAQVAKQKQTVCLKKLVEQSVEGVAASAKKKDISISVETGDKPRQVCASTSHISRVLTNLLGNAIKFTPPKGHVVVRLQEIADGYQVDVIDDGCGIAPQDLPFVFDEFYRGGGTAATKGLGLGLYIAKKIVQEHRGSIWAESPYGEPGSEKGTRVSFVLPKGSS